MKFSRIGLLCGAASLGFVLAPASAQSQAQPAAPAATAAPTSSGDIVVTARRQNERLQDVPVAVSVLAPATLNSKGVFNPIDIQQSTPGLAVTPSVSDRNNVTYTIRGQGFAFATLFPAVITYFNEVPITQLTAGQFFDLANVQVLRGPQGVNFGRVTDGGNVMVAPQKPTNSFGGYLSLKLGNYGLKTGDGAINIPLVDDRLLFRAAFEIGRRDGFTKNIGSGQDLDNTAYESYRASLTQKFTDTLRNETVLSYQRTHDNGTSVVPAGVNPVPLGGAIGAISAAFPGVYGIDARGNVVPFQPGMAEFNAANYLASYQAQLAEQKALGPRKVDYDELSYDRRTSWYFVNTTTADLTDTIQLKNIFGYVNVKDDEASNFTGTRGAAISTCHSNCENLGGGGVGGLPFTWQEQFSEELRLSGKSFDNKLTWSIGGYADRQDPGGQFENDTINAAVLERVNVQYATTTSKAAYASGEYDLGDLLPGLKVNGGVRYTHDTVVSKNQVYQRPIYFPTSGVGSIPAIPHGQCTTYEGTDCQTYSAAFNATTWTGGVSYKPTKALLVYAKVSRGYRPGGVNGSPAPGTDPSYNPEFDTSVEIGLKGDFHFGGSELRTDIAAYHDRYTKIQKLISLQSGSIPVSLTTNAANATVQGVELETTFIPFRGLSIGGTFAYTDAKYDKNGYVPGGANDPCDPTSFVPLGWCPLNRFNATPKTQFTINASYTLPLDESIGRITVAGNYYHQSSIATTDTSAQNPDAIQKAYGTLDFNVTWANFMNKPIDLGFFMTNATNKLYTVSKQSLTQNSSFGTLAYIYAPPRMFGFSLKYRFGSDANGR